MGKPAKKSTVMGLGLGFVCIVALFTAHAWIVPSEAIAEIGPIEESMGVDLLQASGTLHLQVPAGFLRPSSSAFAGDVPLVGRTIGTAASFELGTTCFVLERNTDLVLDSVGSTSEIIIRALEFQMDSSGPIVVNSNGVPEAWQVSVGILETEESWGTYTLNRTSEGDGALELTMDMHLFVEFTSGATVRRMELGKVTFTSTGGAWEVLSASPTAALSARTLALGVAFSAMLNSTHLDLQVTPAQVDPMAPGPASVDASASVAPSARLGRNCTIGPNVTVGDGAVIGPSAVLLNGATIGNHALVGQEATVGVNASLAEGAILEADAALMGGAQIGAESYVGRATTIGEASTIGDDVVIGAECVVGGDAVIHDGVTVGASVTVGSNSSIAAGLEIADGAVIAANTDQDLTLVRCWLDSGGYEIRPMPDDNWEEDAEAAAVYRLNWTGEWDSKEAIPGDVQASVIPPDPANPPTGYSGLAADIGTKTAPKKNGGEVELEDRECAWFAEDLRRRLAALGYDTTFTAVLNLNPDWTPYRGKHNLAEKWVGGHALTDVHWPDGSVTWIEPQLINGKGIDRKYNNGKYMLDGNEDGKVTYSNGRTDKCTDGKRRIEVYKSRAEAEKAGHSCPGRAN